jgi:hypothetical protein
MQKYAVSLEKTFLSLKSSFSARTKHRGRVWDKNIFDVKAIWEKFFKA